MYDPVPPVALTVAAPVEPPKHATLVCAEAVALKAAAGWEMVKLWVAVHELASVTVTVYVPAAKLLAVMPVPPEGDQEYV